MPTDHLRRRTTRLAPIQFRVEGDPDQGRFRARVIQYNVVDDYYTIFAPGVFTESLKRRLPRVVWSHDWSEPLGRYIDYDDTPTHLDLIGEFDDFEAVPRARQAYHQLKSGTIDQFSVGFVPEAGEEVLEDEQYYFKFTRARLDEVSLVLAGAVPGTELLAVRNRIQVIRTPQATISKDLAAQTILDMHEGRIDLADALQTIKNAAVDQGPEPEPQQEPEPKQEGGEGEQKPPEPEATPPAAEPSSAEPVQEPAPAVEPEPEPPAVPPTEPAAEPVQPPAAPEPTELDLSDLADIDNILLTHDISA